MRTFLVTGGAGFIGSHIAEGAGNSRRQGARARQSVHRPPGNLKHLEKQDRVHRGRRHRPGRRGRGRQRRRLRLPRGGAGLGAAQRRAAAGHECRLRDRHADGARRRRARRACGGWSMPPRAAPTATSPLRRSAKPICPPRFRPTAPPSWPASCTARRFRPRMASRPCPFATSTSSDRGRIRNSQYSAVIPLFITAMLAGRQPTIYGDGQQSRDFTYVANVVHGNLLAADADAKLVAGRTLNVANGRSTSLLELIAVLNELLGTQDRAGTRAAARGRRARKPGRYHAGPQAARLRAASRFRGRPAPLDRLLPADR